jgi:tetratricopeptide (TPR) repeat protein
LYYIPLKEYDKAAADFEEATVLLKGDNTLGSNPWFKEFMKDLATWGIDMYEAGAHEQALSLLAGIDKLRRAVGADPNSAEVAYIAMSLRQLGRGKEAETTLEQLRSMHENSRKSESLKWLCRAEKVFAGQDSAIGQVWECIELGRLNDAQQHLKELQPMAIQQNTDIRADIARATRILAGAYYERGRNARYNGAGYSETISDYRAALRVDPNYARAYSDLGWLLATCPETEFRDEALAIENATKACELTGWKSHRPIGVLAAFYAETGNFENAVKWQQKAIDLAAEEDIPRWQPVHESRLRLYQSEKTYRGSDPWSLSTGGMIAHWNFELTDGKVVKDSSGNGLDGRFVGDAQIIEDPDRGGQVLRLDGDHDWVDCGKGSIFDFTSEITIACWIKVDSFDETWQTIISKGDSTWRLSRDRDSNQLHFACTGVAVPDDIYGSVRGKTNVNDGKWHYVAGVYDGTRSCLYIDGVLDVSSEASGEIGTNAWSVLIGANEETTAQERPDRSFDGLIDDMRIYDYALTEAEIKTLYGERKSVPNEN